MIRELPEQGRASEECVHFAESLAEGLVVEEPKDVSCLAHSPYARDSPLLSPVEDRPRSL